MKRTRTHYAVLNTSISGAIYIMNTLLKFFMRSVFIYFLGKEYLGVNSLFTSVIGMLSLSELGIGSAIVYSLYTPLADDDYPKIKSLMLLYKKIYIIIGCIIAVIGLLILPAIPYIINNSSIDHICYIYILFLLNSVLSYFFSYNRSLLNADQKNYIMTIVTFICTLITNLVQIFVLWISHSFILYICISIVFTLIDNIIVKKIVDKEYSYLRNVEPIRLDKQSIKILKRNSFGNFMDKIGSSVVISTDNIYISIFAGVGIVGLYNNYMTIISAITSLMGQINNALMGGLGNLVATSDNHKAYSIFKKCNFINFFSIFMFSAGSLVLMSDFVKCWVGSPYMLSSKTVLLIVISYILGAYRNTTLAFISSYGLSWYTRWKVFWECLLNILFSAVFLLKFKLGLNGVILGTIFSTVLVVEWWEPYALFKYGFKMSIIPYIKIMIKNFIVLTLNMILVWIVISNIHVTGWIMLFVKGFCVVLLSLIFFVLIYGRSEEFKYTVNMIKKILHRR